MKWAVCFELLCWCQNIWLLDAFHNLFIKFFVFVIWQAVHYRCLSRWLNRLHFEHSWLLKRHVIHFVSEQLLMHVSENALVQVQNYLPIHWCNLVLHAANFTLRPIQRLMKFIESPRVRRWLAARHILLLLLIILLVHEIWEQNWALPFFDSLRAYLRIIDQSFRQSRYYLVHCVFEMIRFNITLWIQNSLTQGHLLLVILGLQVIILPGNF